MRCFENVLHQRTIRSVRLWEHRGKSFSPINISVVFLSRSCLISFPLNYSSVPLALYEVIISFDFFHFSFELVNTILYHFYNTLSSKTAAMLKIVCNSYIYRECSVLVLPNRSCLNREKFLIYGIFNTKMSEIVIAFS